MTSQQLQARGIGVTLGSRPILRQVDLTAAAGEWLTIAGPSGSGKSVLLHVLAGLRIPDDGAVLVDGQPAWSGPSRQAAPGVVLQAYGLVSLLTAAETAALPLQARGAAKEDVITEPRRWLEALGLAAAADQLVSQLSGGQRQRVALARALAAGSPFLFLDEPTAELDAANRDVVLGLLRARADDGGVLVVVSHDPAILDVSDTVVHLDAEGQIVS